MILFLLFSRIEFKFVYLFLVYYNCIDVLFYFDILLGVFVTYFFAAATSKNITTYVREIRMICVS